MAAINFYLKDSNSNTETNINLHYYFTNQRLKYYTGEKINPKHWNPDTQQARKNYTGSSELNLFLNRLKEELSAILRSTKANCKELTSEEIKVQLNKAINKSTTVVKGFFDHLDDYYSIKTTKATRSYLKKVTTLKNHLREFEKAKAQKITFTTIDLNFYDHFTAFLLKEKNHLNSTVGSNISVLKTFLRWATSRGINNNLQFQEKEFTAFKGDTDIVHLTNDELMHIYKLDLKPGSKMFNIRESFCFACFTGLRFSDVMKVNGELIRDEELTIVTTKTKEKLTIPLNDFAIEILRRNNNKLPIVSNQKSNDYIKELAELAELNDLIVISKGKGAEAIETTLPKHKFITTHTARRTFITLSLEKGMRAETVMKVTGHKDYKTFKKYIAITDGVKAVEMKEAWNMPKLKAV